ncbi:hypothetical protein D3C81_1940470 [compost metagenome]
MAWSVRDSASRMEPWAPWASRRKAGCSKVMPSCPRILSRWLMMWPGGICLRLNCRQRDSTVTGIFCGSVVARMNLTCSGGSSRVFSMELNAWFVSMCTSSII